MASGTSSTALGNGALASGGSSTVVGNGASATGNNAVAVGAGSVASRDNAVSVGTAGGERQVTNVAPGTQPTDAVNLGQLQQGMQTTLNQANAYTDNKFNQLQTQIDTVHKDAMGAAAAGMAMASLPQAYLPGKSMLAAGLANTGAVRARSRSASRRCRRTAAGSASCRAR